MMNQNENEKNAIPLNMQKYENYKEQFKRLNRALANGFNLEAIFIEYALMEDRTESVLRHAGKWEDYVKSRTKRGRPINIDSKIRTIEKLAENKKDLLNKYFSDEILKDILHWKEERNRLIHALLKQQFEHKEISEMAQNGKELISILRNRVGNYNRAVKRQRTRQESGNGLVSVG